VSLERHFGPNDLPQVSGVFEDRPGSLPGRLATGQLLSDVHAFQVREAAVPAVRSRDLRRDNPWSERRRTLADGGI
jgi:hypothetical protein